MLSAPGLGRAPAGDEVVRVHQPHVDGRTDRDAPPLHDAPVEVGGGRPDFFLGAELPGGLRQPPVVLGHIDDRRPEQRVTGLPMQQLSSMIGRQLPLFSLIVPFWVVCAMVGWRGMLGVWPAALAGCQI